MVSRFLKVRCKCKNEQVISGKASSPVLCVICGEKLADSTGGKTNVLAQVQEVLE